MRFMGCRKYEVKHAFSIICVNKTPFEKKRGHYFISIQKCGQLGNDKKSQKKFFCNLKEHVYEPHSSKSKIALLGNY